jgi:hypothetical protein
LTPAVWASSHPATAPLVVAAAAGFYYSNTTNDVSSFRRIQTAPGTIQLRAGGPTAADEYRTAQLAGPTPWKPMTGMSGPTTLPIEFDAGH